MSGHNRAVSLFDDMFETDEEDNGDVEDNEEFICECGTCRIEQMTAAERDIHQDWHRRKAAERRRNARQQLGICEDRMQFTCRWCPRIRLTGEEREEHRAYHQRMMEMRGDALERRRVLTGLFNENGEDVVPPTQNVTVLLPIPGQSATLTISIAVNVHSSAAADRETVQVPPINPPRPQNTQRLQTARRGRPIRSAPISTPISRGGREIRANGRGRRGTRARGASTRSRI